MISKLYKTSIQLICYIYCYEKSDVNFSYLSLIFYEKTEKKKKTHAP